MANMHLKNSNHLPPWLRADDHKDPESDPLVNVPVLYGNGDQHTTEQHHVSVLAGGGVVKRERERERERGREKERERERGDQRSKGQQGWHRRIN